MKKTVMALIILTMMIVLTSCGSRKDAAGTGNGPVRNEEANTATKKSMESIDNIMKSVETSVDSIENAVDINTEGL